VREHEKYYFMSVYRSSSSKLKARSTLLCSVVYFYFTLQPTMHSTLRYPQAKLIVICGFAIVIHSSKLLTHTAMIFIWLLAKTCWWPKWANIFSTSFKNLKNICCFLIWWWKIKEFLRESWWKLFRYITICMNLEKIFWGFDSADFCTFRKTFILQMEFLFFKLDVSVEKLQRVVHIKSIWELRNNRMLIIAHYKKIRTLYRFRIAALHSCFIY